MAKQQFTIQINVNTKQVSSQLKTTQNNFRSFFSDVKRLATGFVFGDLIAGGIRQVGFALRQAAVGVIEFDQLLKNVQKTTNISDKELKKLSKAFIDISSESPIAAKELAQIGIVAGQLGVKGTKNIETFTKNIAKIAVATGLTADAAARDFAKIATAAGFVDDDLPDAINRIASAVNELENTTAATTPEILEAMKKVGGSARVLGVTADQVAALSASLISLGIDSSTAGTSLKNSFIFATSKADEFGKVIGKSGAEVKAALSKDAIGTIKLFIKQLAFAANKGEQLALAETIFGTRSSQAIIAFAESLGLLEKNLRTSAEAFEENTSIQREFEIQSQGAERQVQALLNAVNSIILRLGSKLTPIFVKIVKVLADFARALGGDSKALDRALQKIINLTGLTTEGFKQLLKLTATLVGTFFTFRLVSKVFDTFATNIVRNISLRLGTAIVKFGRTFGEITTSMQIKWLAFWDKAFLTATRAQLRISNAFIKLKTGIKTFLVSPLVSVKMAFTSLKTSFLTTITSMRLNIKKAGLDFLKFVRTIKVGSMIARGAILSLRIAIKLLKVAISFGLLLVVDFIIERIVLFNEKIGGLRNTLELAAQAIGVAWNGVKTIFIKVLRTIVEKLNNFRIFGKQIFSMDNLLEDLKTAEKEASKTLDSTLHKLITTNRKFRSETAKKNLGGIASEEQMKEFNLMLAQQEAELKKSLQKKNKAEKDAAEKSADAVANINLNAKQESLLELLGIEEKFRTKELAVFAEMTAGKLSINRDFLDVENLRRLENEKKIKDKFLSLLRLQKEEELEFKTNFALEETKIELAVFKDKLQQEFDLQTDFEWQKLKLKDEFAAKAFQRDVEQAKKSSKEIETIAKSTPLDFILGKGFEKLAKKGGIAGGILGAATSFGGQALKGEAGAKEAVTEGAKFGLAAAFGPLGAIAGEFVGILAEGPEKVKETFTAFFEGLPKTLIAIVESIPVFIETILRSIPTLIENLLLAIPQIVRTLLDFLVLELPFVIIDFVEQLLISLPDILVQVFEQLVEFAPEFIERLAERIPMIINRIIQLLPSVMTFFATRLVQKIPMIMTAMTAELIKNTPKIVASFIKEFVAGIPTIVKEFARALVDSIKGAFRGVFRIFKFAEGGVVPPGFPDDSAPSMLTSGERVLSVEQNRAFERGLLLPPGVRPGSAFFGGDDPSIGRNIQKEQNVNMNFSVVINTPTVEDPNVLSDMIMDKIRTEAARGREILTQKDIGE